MEKYISVPHDRKKMFCFPSHEKIIPPPLPQIRKWLLPNLKRGVDMHIGT
jgi:hypothetical protein